MPTQVEPFSQPKTAKTTRQGIDQGPDDRGRGEESSSSTARPSSTSGRTVMVSVCSTDPENGAALVACATVSAASPGRGDGSRAM